MTHLLPQPATEAPSQIGAVAGAPAPRQRPRGDRVWWRHLIGLVALVFALFPIVFLVSAALNPVGTLSTTSLLPDGVSLNNFAKLLSDPNSPYLRWYGNTLLICGVSAMLNVLIGAGGAFAFSRLRFRGRRAGLITVLLVQMFPNFIAVVALYLVFIQIGSVFPAAGLNTSLGLILVYLGGAMGVNTWLLKGYLDTIPRELDESALIDGATSGQVFFRITLPLAAPMLVVVGLFSFVANLNEILLANVFLTDTSQKTLAIGLFGLVSGEHNTDYGEFAAGSLLAGLPVVLIYLYLQKYLVKGLTAGAVKG
ncbi:sugar ABC transporter permease [Streptomyces sp. RB6PN25]|uniref:Sugar ABC transporter permease n=1 Tax=Streptomyces humicola TaxID=2953240 RepID=A0ABT1Q2G5_9ACTN|nr:sugar ABC transporter permease [Streptomyces humicola]MCQ4084069.1 sugar ABC transporter permease [Streptomyces humicola]